MKKYLLGRAEVSNEVARRIRIIQRSLPEVGLKVRYLIGTGKYVSDMSGWDETKGVVSTLGDGFSGQGNESKVRVGST